MAERSGESRARRVRSERVGAREHTTSLPRRERECVTWARTFLATHPNFMNETARGRYAICVFRFAPKTDKDACGESDPERPSCGAEVAAGVRAV